METKGPETANRKPALSEKSPYRIRPQALNLIPFSDMLPPGMALPWLKSWKIRAVIAIYAILLGLFVLLLPIFILFQLPSPYRLLVVTFLDETCGGRAANTEAGGVYENRDSSSTDTWRIAIYNGQCKHRFFFGLGGDDFRGAASRPEFTHRINAQSATEAAAFLSKLIAERPVPLSKLEITILDHGAPGVPRFASQAIPESFYSTVRHASPLPVTLRFYGCAIAQGSKGESFMQQLAGTYGFKVIASKEQVAWNTFRWGRSQIVNVPAEDWVVTEPPALAAAE